MGDGLVGAMVDALRRANRQWGDRSRLDATIEAPRAGASWGYLTHPALLPTVFCPDGDDCLDGRDAVAVRRV